MMNRRINPSLSRALGSLLTMCMSIAGCDAPEDEPLSVELRVGATPCERFHGKTVWISHEMDDVSDYVTALESDFEPLITLPSDTRPSSTRYQWVVACSCSSNDNVMTFQRVSDDRYIYVDIDKSVKVRKPGNPLAGSSKEFIVAPSGSGFTLKSLASDIGSTKFLYETEGGQIAVGQSGDVFEITEVP